MLKWLGKMLGDTPAALAEQPAADASTADWAVKLRTFLQPIASLAPGKVRAGLVPDLVDYVLTGEPTRVLQEVSSIPEVSNYLSLNGLVTAQMPNSLMALYKDFNNQPVATGLRWARLLEASMGVTYRALQLPFPHGRRWPELLIINSAGSSPNSYGGGFARVDRLDAAYFEALLEADGMPASALVDVAFGPAPATSRWAEHRLKILRNITGMEHAIERHLALVQPKILAGDARARLHVLYMLEIATPHSLKQLAPELAELATGSSRQVRAAALATLKKSGGAEMHDALKALALNAKPDQRAHALRLAMLLGKENDDALLQQFARSTAQADKAPSVQALLNEWDGRAFAMESEDGGVEVAMPDIDWTGGAGMPSRATLQRLWKDVNDAVDSSNVQSRNMFEQARARGRKVSLTVHERYTSADATLLHDYLAGTDALPADYVEASTSGWGYGAIAIKTLQQDKDVSPLALLKTLKFFSILTDQRKLLSHVTIAAMEECFRRSNRPTLLELSVMLEKMDVSPQAIAWAYCPMWGKGLAAKWPAEAVWPYFAKHTDWLRDRLATSGNDRYSFKRDSVFRAIAQLPSLPGDLAQTLFDLAVGPVKADRVPAQEAVRNHPARNDRLMAALADGKADARAAAAIWAARIQLIQAIPVLEHALEKEQNDVTKGHLLDALQVLGQPTEKYLNRQALAIESAKAMKKATAKGLEWFPWEQIPKLRWADSLEDVPSDTVRFMIIQAVKQKLPEPNAMLRKYCSMFEQKDREKFGQWLLEIWLQEDVRPIAAEEALIKATAQANQLHGWMARAPQSFQNNPLFGKSLSELTASYLPTFMRQPAGSAVATKGLLALVAACAGEGAVPPIARYLKEWYGTRPSQGKSLIAALAWIEHPSATQLMLSIGSRFRTKSFQTEATKQAKALAERRGWTLLELADRTVPTAGFDETGALELSYGERSFRARLLPDFKIELFNPEGKKIVSLPEARADDDQELVKESKKAFAACKKEVKAIVQLQTERLYEALCTSRTWSFEDWDVFLNRHPVQRYLVQRLVWAEVKEKSVVRSFRPLEDGSLSSVEDDEVALQPTARVCLLHESLLSPETAAQWQQHLLDYDIAPLFQQFGKQSYRLSPELQDTQVIKDFEGHLVETFKLRGRANKLGYMRGAPMDGGWFFTYEKRMPTLGLVAVIEFTGNPLPEESRTAALLNLHFNYLEDGSGVSAGKADLGQVPAVLLSECYNDMRTLSRDGYGFDPDWQKKSNY